MEERRTEGTVLAGNKRTIGTFYEEQAAAYLCEQGYRVIESNYRNRYGEIDLILRDSRGLLVMTEVKYRSSSCCGDPLEAVDSRKQKRICRTALGYYKEHGYSWDTPCRFDVIGIYGNGQIRHIENAFFYCC